jgi:hypothetical protein
MTDTTAAPDLGETRTELVRLKLERSELGWISSDEHGRFISVPDDQILGPDDDASYIPNTRLALNAAITRDRSDDEVMGGAEYAIVEEVISALIDAGRLRENTDTEENLKRKLDHEISANDYLRGALGVAAHALGEARRAYVYSYTEYAMQLTPKGPPIAMSARACAKIVEINPGAADLIRTRAVADWAMPPVDDVPAILVARD